MESEFCSLITILTSVFYKIFEFFWNFLNKILLDINTILVKIHFEILVSKSVTKILSSKDFN